MKTRSLLLLASALASFAVAQNTTTNAAPATSTDPITTATITLPLADATLIKPFALHDGVLSQPERTDLKDGGRAVFNFKIITAGDYLVRASVNAPGEDKNSFFVNIDAPPEDPAMVWDFDITNGFAERTVSWRGNGDIDWSEFSPKLFNLSTGNHQLILVGREPAQLKNLSLVRWTAPNEGTIEAIQQRYDEADMTYAREVRKLPDTPEGEKSAQALGKNRYDSHAEQFMAAVRLAAAHPNSPTGFSALEWVIKKPHSEYTPAGPAAIKLMAQQYAADSDIGPALASLVYYPHYPEEEIFQPTLTLLNAVLAKNTDHTALGHATLGLAYVTKSKFQNAEARGTNQAELSLVAKETEMAFEHVLNEFGDCPDLHAMTTSSLKRTLGQKAESELREIRQLSIGKLAPDIEGEDTDGLKMKLSDSRGKVVLLVFWASWCGPCMQCVPHEKELVERFKNRPFVLIGVNGDDTQRDAAKAVKKNEIPWRSFWNGAKGPGNSIASEWNVRGWPTLYVIDPNGIIREKYRRGLELDAPLEKLVAEAEKSTQ